MLRVCILLSMMALALATAVMATNGTWGSYGSSYSLIIEKKFDKTMDQAVLAEAQKQTYRFRIEGYRLNGARERVNINEVVEIGPDSDDWQSETFYSEGPIYVSVSEITNDVTLKVGDKEYNMGDSRAEASTLFDESPQVRELNNNGKIVLSRPKEKIIYENGEEKRVPVTTTSTFRITSRWTAAEAAKPAGWKPYDKTVTLGPGDIWVLGAYDAYHVENDIEVAKIAASLPAGEYTIEDLSVSGYNIQLGPRTETVNQTEAALDTAAQLRTGETAQEEHGIFYINSYPGKLVITAGGTAGDGGKHYFTVKRIEAPDDAKPFTDRTTDAVESKQTYTLDDLPRGKYQVTEYTFADAPTKFTVKAPQIEDEEKSFKFINYTAAGETIARYYITMGGDYVDGFRYGPIYNKNGKMLPETELYNVRYIANWLQEDGSTVRGAYKADNRKGTYYYTLKDTIIPGTGNQRLAFGVGETATNTGGYCLLKWVEHTRVENDYTAKDANVNYSITVNDQGWIAVTAPAGSTGAGAENIFYTYELRKSKADEEPIQTLKLEPGKTGKFEGLEAGRYLLMERVSHHTVGFTMNISGGPLGSTEAGKPMEITVLDERTLTITKPQGSKDDTRDYTFIVTRAESNADTKSDGETQKDLAFPITIKLKAGGKSIPISLPKGTYIVTPVDDMTEVFELQCTDSSQVHAKVPSSHSASVTFTNVFTEGSLGYRYVHEYYIKNEDGTYQYEGCSPVATVGGRANPNEFYNSVDITKETVFTHTNEQGEKQTFHYEYMPENNGYGYVTDQAWSGEAYQVAPGLHPSNRGSEKGSTQKTIYYHVDKTLTDAKKIGVDENKSQIIILRYFRVLPEDQKGEYKYVHIYYHRTAVGDIWEGTSALGTKVGQLHIQYGADGIKLEPDFKPKSAEAAYHYVFDGRPNYGTLTSDHTAPHIEHYPVSTDPSDNNHYHYNPNSNADYVIATEKGDQIIILRYYREEKAVTEGTYKVVHEYYFREKLEEQGSGDVSEDNAPGGGESGETESQAQALAEGRTLPQEGTGGGEEASPGTDTPAFSGTLSSDDKYSYTFEGRREIETLNAPLGSAHKDSEVDKQYRLDGNPYTYEYKDAIYGSASGSEYHSVPNMEWAASTEAGNEIIILRYYRGTEPDPDPGRDDGPDPTPTPKPTPTVTPSPSPTPVPSTTPVPSATPTPEPTPTVTPPTETPTPPPELPDPNDPDSPETVTIEDGGVPKTYVKVWNPETEEWEYIEEGEVPLWSAVPATGERNGLAFWAALAAVSLGGLSALLLPHRKQGGKRARRDL